MEKEFEQLVVTGLSAQLDGNYSQAVRIFNTIINKYPKEGSPIIRKMYAVYLGGERIQTAEQLHNYISALDSAEELIKTGVSKYAMDKFQGLRDLYFLRGFFKSVLGGAVKSYLREAISDFDKCLVLDPNYQPALKLKTKSYNEYH